MHELALFAGAGGGCLASRLLGHRIVGYVESEAYPQEVIKARIADGCLDAAPIFGDIRAFVRDGWPEHYRGKVDLVSGGFPCQDISDAGKRAGISGERSGLWQSMAEVVAGCRPRWVFVENSAALAHRGLGEVLRSLAAMGFDAEWGVFSACAIGAPHTRERLFIVAHADSEPGASRMGNRERQESNNWTRSLWGDSDEERTEGYFNVRMEARTEISRNADGLARRVDRLKAIGNGQVPIVAATAFRTLATRFLK